MSEEVLAAGRAALERGAWAEARELFERELSEGEVPEALEGLATAARWLFDGDVALSAGERAYRLYAQRGNRRSAARVALLLAIVAYNLLRSEAITSGWLERARRLLDGLGPVAEAALMRALEAHIALIQRNDAAWARALSAEALELAREAEAVDIEMLVLGLDGLALVTQGSVKEGLRQIDEAVAAAVAGEVSDPELLQTIYCYLIYACKRLRDFDRAGEWCARLAETATKWSDRQMFAICRVHYADVLLWRGAWSEAEAELEGATATLDDLTVSGTADGRVRLADLRRRQGRLDEAERFLASAETHPLAPIVRGHLELERGDALAAAESAERYLRRIPRTQLTERTAALELLACACMQAGELEVADGAVAELEEIASVIGTKPVQGAHAFVAGLRAAAAGAYDEARRLLEDAVDLLAAGRSPYESARARVALARVLDALGRRRSAEHEAEAAIEVLTRLGAEREARSAALLLSKPPADPNGLTRRELEILQLVAAGKSNEQIAADLVLSPRTVERHVSNVYGKLGLSGAAARAAAIAYAASRGYV